MTKVSVAFVCSLALASCSAPDPEGATGASSEPDPNVVEIGIEAQDNIGLTMAPATRSQLTEYLHVVGTVQPIDSRVGHVRSLASGRVQEVLVKAGDRVEEGQPLARFDNIEAGDLVAQHLAAQAGLEKLRFQEATSARQLERSKSLVEIGATSQKDFELAQTEHRAALEAMKAQESVLTGLESRLRRFGLASADLPTSSITTIPSPFAGVVTTAQVAPGEVVDPEMELFSVADLSEVWVQAEVYERDVGRIQIGQTALIAVDTYPDETFSGEVAYVSEMLNPKTRSAQVRCVVPNHDWRLKLNMLVSVDVPTTFSQQVIVVPAAAIHPIAGRTVVFVRDSETRFRTREVEVGRVIDGQAEIVAGLLEEEAVVVQGAYHLRSVLLNREEGEGED
jgi:cobalt-zinc-cadmium efflux system membrane fusion protein